MLRFRLNLKNVIAIAICITVTTMFSGCKDDDMDPPQKPIIIGALSNECPEITTKLTASAVDAIYFQWKKNGVVIEGQTTPTLTISESGAYTVAGVNEAGTGIFSDSQNVTILKCSPQQAIVVGAESNECPETTITLTASAVDAISFQWKKDGVVIEGETTSTLTISESGAYTVAGVNEAGTGVFSESKNVTILKCSPQQAIVVGAESNECPETTITLTASAVDAISFQWKKDGVVIEGETTSTLTIFESGAYTVAGVNEAGSGIFSDSKNVIILSCIPPPIASFTYVDDMDFFSLTSTSTGEISNYQWHISGNQQAMLLSPTRKSTALELPSVATTMNVSLTVKNNGGSSTSSQNITLPPLTFGRQYGLGRNTTNEGSNNVNHEWYIDQVNTGQYSYDNCGPTCATMAIKWSNQYFSKTVEDARNTYLPQGGWWYTSNIIDYLTDNHTAHYVTSLTQTSHLRNQLDNGNIAILCLDIYYVRTHLGKPEWRIDKYYSTYAKDAGHFIIVKGYKIVDGIVWLEVYDPWSLGVKYNNGTLKGIDRYYRGEDIIKATDVWWKYMIVVNNPATPSVRSQAIDPSTIVHQRGR